MTTLTSSLTREYLIQEALQNQEGTLTADGVLAVTTGSRTGRSPKDRYIVSNPSVNDKVDWGAINRQYDAQKFESLWEMAQEHLEKKSYHAILFAGADPSTQISLSVTTEFAWHQLFAKNLFIDADQEPTENLWTILNAPTLQIDRQAYGTNSESAVMLDLAGKRILIIGMRYAGEMKKAVFSALNFWLPESNILPMHCSSNMGENGESALFFGLSGTGKTTLSADPARPMIGDDEHGWSKDGIFNFEGGCYAKMINLSPNKEPVIWSAIQPGSVLENVYLDENKVPDFKNTSYSENSRMGFTRELMENRIRSNQGPHPKHVIFLTCDLYGVLPPVSILTKEQALFYFLSGYTAKLGSTEIGSASAISPVFSACFGAPFFSRPVAEYAKLLEQRLEETGARVYLVNTGWHGGACGQGGSRYDIEFTRSIVHQICQGEINFDSCQQLPGFNLSFPTQCGPFTAEQLDPRQAWSDQDAYTQSANALVSEFTNHCSTLQADEKILGQCPKSI